MAFRREWVEEWLAGVAEPGERLVSHAVTATWTGVVVVQAPGEQGLTAEQLRLEGEEVMVRRTEGMPLDPALRVAPFADATFLALTDRRLLLGSRGALRNRPKALLHAASAEDVRIHWFDHSEGVGNRFRHMLIEFGGGHWRSDRSGLSAFGKDLTGTSNIHHFFAALGNRAVALEEDR